MTTNLLSLLLLGESRASQMGLSETSSRLTPSQAAAARSSREVVVLPAAEPARAAASRSDSLVAPGSASGFRRSLVGADNTLIEAVAEASREGAAADADAAAESTEMIRYELITVQGAQAQRVLHVDADLRRRQVDVGHAMLMLEREGKSARVGPGLGHRRPARCRSGGGGCALASSGTRRAIPARNSAPATL